MSIEFEDDNKGTAAPAQASARPSNGAERPQRSESRDEDRDVRPARRNLARGLARAIGRNGASESLTKAYEAFHNYISEYPDDVADVLDVRNYQVVRVERSEHRLDLSSLVFVQAAEHAGKRIAFYYTLLLAGSNPILPPLRGDDRRGRGRDRGAEIPRTPGDVYDEKYGDVIFDLVSKRFDGYALVECGSSVLGAHVNLEKDRAVLESQMFYINAAIESKAAERLTEQDPFSLNWLSADDSLVVDMQWPNEALADVNEQPARTDVLIESSANLEDDDERVYNENLTKAAGYFELVYSPAEVGTGFRARGRRRGREEDETQLVTPKFVVNTLDTNFKAITPELILLGLATTAPLSNDLLWTRAFTEPHAGDGVNYKDIGALNLLVDDTTKRFDTTAPGLSERDLMEYFGTLSRPDLAYAIDVAECAELTWVQEDFIGAAEGDKDALDRIMKAADNLFDNNFSSIFRELVAETGGSRNPFIRGERIINGWYREGRDGPKQDLRNIDLLWWLNRTGDKDREDALDWQDTFDGNEEESVRIEKRLRMLQQILGAQNVHVTGYSRQVLIDTTFIRALAEAAASCDVHIEAAVTQSALVDTRGRGNSRIVTLAGSDMGSKMFSTRSRRRNRDGDEDNFRGSYRRRR